jgi:RNA polymerase sigma-70 factor, ECF subfamily
VESTADIALTVMRAQAGDREALERVLHAASLTARSVARRIALNDADDVVQEVLWTVARKLTWLEEPRAFHGWVYRIAARQAVRHAATERRRWWMQPAEDIENVSADESVPSALVDAIPGLLERVTARSRAVLVLHYLEGLPLDQVAAVLGIPLGTVKSRLAYGLRALRRAVAERPA